MATTLVLRGVSYPMVPLGSLSLFDLMDMKRETGMTPERYEILMEDLAQVGKPDAMTINDVLGSEDHLMALAIQVWAARRHAGERLTIREAADIPMDEWDVIEDGEEDDEPIEGVIVDPPQGSGEVGDSESVAS